MKGLNQFETFEWMRFAEGKKFQVCGCREWKDFSSGEHCGTEVEVAIVEDNTVYQNTESVKINNLFEKLKFKVKKDIDVPLGAIVIPVDAIAKKYSLKNDNGGKFSKDGLSVKCADIKILSGPKN